jgi:tetratricopeptide (TPR) repeat protein
MSIIAEALKRAQRKSGGKVDEPPPFDLKKTQPPGASPQAAATVAHVPRAKPVSTPGEAPRPRAIAATPDARKVAAAAPTPGAKPAAVAQQAAEAQVKKPKRWGIRIPVIATVILVVFAAAIYYVNKVYLPGLQQEGIQVAAPMPAAPADQTTSEPAESEEQPAEKAQETEQAESEPPQAVERQPEPSGETAIKTVISVPAPESVEPPESPEEKPVAGLVLDEPVEEIPPPPPSEIISPEFSSEEIEVEAEELSALGQDNISEESGNVFENPAEIIQKQRDTDKPLREDIYHFNMAVFFQRQGDIPSALQEYNKVLELSPYNAEVYSNMGVLYNQVGEYDKAVAMLQKSLMIDPFYSKAHNNIALAYYNSGQLERAMEHFSRAVELEPVNLESYNNMGLVYKKMEDYQKAEEAFAKALSIDPDHAPSNYNMALLCEENGQLERAIEHYRAYVRSKGVTPELAGKVNQRLTRLTRTQIPQ